MNDQPTFSGRRTFLQFPDQLSDGQRPDVTVVGIPFDLGTTNRPGCRFGPAGIREASLMLLDGDHPELRVNPGEDLRCIDAGDLDIANGYLEKSVDMIEGQVRGIDGHLVALGGDHTVTLPILRAQAERHGKGVSLLHFDAHVDTWKENFGGPVGHGTPFHYAAQEGLIDPKRSIQIGIRSPVDNDVMDYTTDELGFHVVSAEQVHTGGVEAVVAAVKKTVGDNAVYLTFDIDGIDPSQAPGTGTPEVGGLFTWQALAIMKKLGDLNLVSMDMVEVAPAYDQAQITSLAAATFVWTYLCLLAVKKNK
ncbi:MAG: agmatinase [Rhodospirillaceae bacterium]|nr:agmatinase [Rhodospirillaceae bacterium]